MQKQMFPDASPELRKQMLIDNCTFTQEDSYTRKYTEEELQDMKQEFVNSQTKFGEQEDEFKAEQSAFNLLKKSVKAHCKELLGNIKRKFITEKGQLFYFADQEEGMMGVYDINGDLVESRRLKPEERQTNIFNLKQKAS